MTKHIAIVQGHPEPKGGHFCHALANSYAQGAAGAGHEVRTIEVARLTFPLLRTQDDWENALFPEEIRKAQETLGWADHVVFLYPLWLGSMPALLKAFLEQVLRPGFAMRIEPDGWEKLLTGKSARIVVTMGMPAFIYRWYFGAHSLKSLERNILGLVGIGPVRETLIGSIETCGKQRRVRWLGELRELGRAGQ